MFDPVSRLALARSHGVLHKPTPLAGGRPLVSVVVPCYNYGHFLPACISSALEQTGVEIEVIIVDDASPDGSGEIAAQLASTDDRVSLIRHEENRGHLATYNDGFSAASGKYLVQLSADDLLPPDSLARSVALLEAHPSVGFSYGYAAHFVGRPPAPRTSVRGWATWRGEDWVAERCRAGYNVIQTTEVVMRTEVVRAVGAYRLDLPHTGDLELWMRMATIADVGFVIGPDQAWYRLHDTNMHSSVFRGGTMEGQFVDLEQRWLAFDALFSGPTGRLQSPRQLADVARRTLATEALQRSSYAYMRGFRDYPVEKLVKLATSLVPTIGSSSAGRALARRQRLGMLPIPVNPLWVPRGVFNRLGHKARQRSMRRVGV